METWAYPGISSRYRGPGQAAAERFLERETGPAEPESVGAFCFTSWFGHQHPMCRETATGSIPTSFTIQHGCAFSSWTAKCGTYVRNGPHEVARLLLTLVPPRIRLDKMRGLEPKLDFQVLHSKRGRPGAAGTVGLSTETSPTGWLRLRGVQVLVQVGRHHALPSVNLKT